MQPNQEILNAIIAEILDLELATQDEIDRAHHAVETDNAEPITFHLVKLGIVDTATLTPILGNHFDVPAVNLNDILIDANAVELLSLELALRYRALPIEIRGNRVIVAIANPHDIYAIDDIRYACGMDIEVAVADPCTLLQKIERSYNHTDNRVDDALEELQSYDEVTRVEETDFDDSVDDDITQIEDAPLVRLVSGLLHEAVRRKASDIHVEPYENRIRVRYRIDGVLTEVYRLPRNLRNPIISRIKIMSDLNIGEKRKPQDGRTKLRVGTRVIDFRVSTMPTAFGEKAVLRILDKSSISLDLDALGIEERARNIIDLTLSQPYGMIIVTGPTGSGKTTTLYSMLAHLNTGQENILTVEDPIEFDLPGINQVQTHHEIDLTFASVLRAFLRQDPDVIMVGEMRDGETVNIALQASLTGHLVLSTLHTNDAASAFMRMINMGAEKHNIANAVTMIIAQRLARRVCQNCKIPADYDEAYLKFAGVEEAEWNNHPFVVGAGCEACDGIGYKGRHGLYEVLPVSHEILNMIMRQANSQEIKDQAVKEGMKTLRMIGMELARAGKTTLEEVVLHTRE